LKSPIELEGFTTTISITVPLSGNSIRHKCRHLTDKKKIVKKGYGEKLRPARSPLPKPSRHKQQNTKFQIAHSKKLFTDIPKSTRCVPVIRCMLQVGFVHVPATIHPTESQRKHMSVGGRITCSAPRPPLRLRAEAGCFVRGAYGPQSP